MSTIADLEHRLCALEIAGLPNTTVCTYAAVQIMDSHTLAVVLLSYRHADLIEQTIADQNLVARVSAARNGVITITI